MLFIECVIIVGCDVVLPCMCAVYLWLVAHWEHRSSTKERHCFLSDHALHLSPGVTSLLFSLSVSFPSVSWPTSSPQLCVCSTLIGHVSLALKSEVGDRKSIFSMLMYRTFVLFLL